MQESHRNNAPFIVIAYVWLFGCTFKEIFWRIRHVLTWCVFSNSHSEHCSCLISMLHCYKNTKRFPPTCSIQRALKQQAIKLSVTSSYLWIRDLGGCIENMVRDQDGHHTHKQRDEGWRRIRRPLGRHLPSSSSPSHPSAFLSFLLVNCAGPQ